MLVPAPLHGTAKQVARRAATWVRRSVRTGGWTADLVEVRDHEGLVLLGSAIGLGEQPAFHCHLPPEIVKADVTRQLAEPAAENQAFQAWLGSAWGVLGLMAPSNVMWFRDPERYRPFLTAAVTEWPAIEEVGPRYSVGSAHGQDVWSVHSNVKYVLANMGLPAERLSAPLPAGGLAALVEETANWNGIPVVEQW